MALHDPDQDAASRRAIIDIGSNTVRLVIYEGSPRAPSVIYNEKVSARLGKNVAEDGKLSAKASGVALAALTRYALTLRLQQVASVDCVATAAVRDASNGAKFLEKVAALGLRPRLLSGEEEATASARGVLAAFPGARGVVGDLGGGSLELIDIDGTSATHGVSMPLGSLRLPGLRANGPRRFARRVRSMLHASDWEGEHGATFYLVGGSWRALARYAMLAENWPVDDPHGYVLSAERALKIARRLTSGKSGLETPGGVEMLVRRSPGISASRAVALPHAAALLSVLVRELKPARLVFSSWGLREGLIAEACPDDERGRDPLLIGVEDFVADFHGDNALRATQVCDWIAPLEPAIDARSAVLRRAGVLLAVASMRTEPNLRVEQASDWALRKRWIGIDAEGRAMLAATVRANSGRVGLTTDLLRLAPATRLRDALAWGLATRLCRRMTGLAPAALADTALAIEGEALVLCARGDMVALHTDIVAKDLRLLAETLGLVPQFRPLASGAPLPG